MNRAEIARLAGAVNALRPEWPVSSLCTFITTDLAERPLRDAAVALVWVAADPDSRTPKRVLEAGPWWAIGGTGPGVTRAATAVGELCHHCGSVREHCQSELVQRLDRHPYRTAYQAAVECARAERRRAGQPPLKDWTPTSILEAGSPISPARRQQLANELAKGQARHNEREAAREAARVQATNAQTGAE